MARLAANGSRELPPWDGSLAFAAMPARPGRSKVSRGPCLGAICPVPNPVEKRKLGKNTRLVLRRSDVAGFEALGDSLAALTLRQRPRQQALTQEFDAWGPEAREFHLRLNSRPIKTGVHVRRLLNLAQLYGRTEVLAAIPHAPFGGGPHPLTSRSSASNDSPAAPRPLRHATTSGPP